MSWTVTIEGHPPSVNSMYIKAHGRVIKDPAVAAYQTGVTYQVKLAKPKGWTHLPGTYIRLQYEFFLNRDADCDNLLKALNDAIAIALGVNDRVFLPCVKSKTIGKTIRPEVRVAID